MLRAMPLYSPAWSRVPRMVLVAGMGALAWWAFRAGVDPGKSRARPVTRALQAGGLPTAAPVLAPGGGNAESAALPASGGPVTDEDYEEILDGVMSSSVFLSAPAPWEVDASMDRVVARLRFSSRMGALMERTAPDFTSGEIPAESRGLVPAAVERALRGPAGAAWRAELVAALARTDAGWKDRSLRAMLELWTVTAGETAPEAEYARLRDALAGDAEARAFLQAGRLRLRMGEAPLETLTTLRDEWLAIPPGEPSAGDGPRDPFGTSSLMSPAQEAMWRRLTSVVDRVSPGADYAALDAVLSSIPVNPGTAGPGGDQMNTARAAILAPWVIADPAAAAAWLVSRPGGVDDVLNFTIQNRLGYESLEVISAWVTAFPPGASRDRLAMRAVRDFIPRDLEAARTLAAGIGDARLREEALAGLARTSTSRPAEGETLDGE